MIKDTTKKVFEKINPDNLMETLKNISSFHRIQASTGFRKSAEYCISYLENIGLQAEMLTYPADGVHKTGVYRTLMEWDITSGWCDISGYGRIADYSTAAMSVICRSSGCDISGAELIHLDKGSDEENYSDIDFTGKIVFVQDNINNALWTAEKRGAIGLITDYVLHPETQSEVLRYTSFWWNEDPNEKKFFGFVITPNEGKKLLNFYSDKASKGEKVTATCKIDASHYPGSLDVVSTLLEGTEKEEILLIAHLCHPKNSANDNASGCSAVIEAVNAINSLIKEGTLSPLKRSIRILLVPEMNGTLKYLEDSAAAKRIMAALNLDMVGGRQEKGYGPITLSMLPKSTPSFTEALAQIILIQTSLQYKGLNDGIGVPSFNHLISEFSSGSDHYILSDPLVGIPCTMLGQFPDKYYHTSGDIPEQIDPDILRCSSTTAATFAYILANLDETALLEILNQEKENYAKCLSLFNNAVQAGLMQNIAFAEKHYLNYYTNAFKDAERFLDSKALIEAEIAKLQSIHEAFTNNVPETEKIISENSLIPKRLFSMPVQNLKHAAKFAGVQDAEIEYTNGVRKKLTSPSLSEIFASYYMDGTRTIDDIIKTIEIDLRIKDASPIKDYIKLLHKCGLVEF